jgi:tetratricopeptide (TPR) repeat protein
METTGYVKKQTLYLTIIAALVIGFVGGVGYSVYRSPAVNADPHAHQQQQAAEIIASLEKATEQNPKDGNAWVQLGHAYFDTGQAPKAIAAYLKALELLPGDLNVMTDLGVMYHQDKQHGKANGRFCCNTTPWPQPRPGKWSVTSSISWKRSRPNKPVPGSTDHTEHTSIGLIVTIAAIGRTSRFHA